MVWYILPLLSPKEAGIASAVSSARGLVILAVDGPKSIIIQGLLHMAERMILTQEFRQIFVDHSQCQFVFRALK